jgi:nucleoside phosphorylase
LIDAGRRAEIAALCAALDGWRDEEGRELVVESLLDVLVEFAPQVAQIAGTLLAAQADPSAQEWGRTIREMVEVYEGGLMSQSKELSVDVLILTIKWTELQACLAAFGVDPGDSSTEVADDEVWTVSFNDVSYAIAFVSMAGNVESSIRVGELWSLIDFRAAILVGMAAGVKREVKLGDIVVSESVIAYEFQRMTTNGPVFAPRSYRPPIRRIRRVKTMAQIEPGWSQRVIGEILTCPQFKGIDKTEREKLDLSTPLEIHTGGILAGGKLIEDGTLPDMREELDDRVLAAEMEGAGFAVMCGERNIKWLVIRGVADYGERNRRKSWQFPATYAAAAFVRDAIPNGRLPIFD